MFKGTTLDRNDSLLLIADIIAMLGGLTGSTLAISGLWQRIKERRSGRERSNDNAYNEFASNTIIGECYEVHKEQIELL